MNSTLISAKRTSEIFEIKDPEKQVRKRRRVSNEDYFKLLPSELLVEILQYCPFSKTSLVSRGFLAEHLNMQPLVSVPFNLYFNKHFNQYDWKSIRLINLKVDFLNDKLITQLNTLTQLIHLKIQFIAIRSLRSPLKLPHLTNLVIRTKDIEAFILKKTLNQLSLYTSLKRLKVPYFDSISLSFPFLQNMTCFAIKLPTRCNRTINDLIYLTNLQKLTVRIDSSNFLPFDSIDPFLRLPALTSLGLFNYSLKIESMEKLSRLTHLRAFTYARAFLFDKQLEHIFQLTQLTFLSLENCNFPSNIDFSLMTNLKKLNLSGSNISFKRMISLSKLTGLESLHLDKCSLIGKESLKILKKMSFLKRLDLNLNDPKKDLSVIVLKRTLKLLS